MQETNPHISYTAQHSYGQAKVLQKKDFTWGALISSNQYHIYKKNT